MSRPCLCDRVRRPLGRGPAPGDCYLCWLALHPRGRRYQELWAEPERPPCPHLGPPTGETVPCPCPHRPAAELYRCAVRTVCTLALRVLSIPCCLGCEVRP